ncbi:uncharacterized protein LOC125241657 [Leguminivora glycinivorella]|uniref:uncharacterized protein LOC125241657 n=1 Tax=Leguminivora glycinivorella TaxID=1035111 RepID=UPI0020100A69|nr:uncharacterized protein LOC125241657 [Leguminivora glycinivorella]
MAWRTAIDGSQDVSLALRVMQRRNPKLRTDEWKVVDTVMSELNTRRIVLMDQVSADVIREAGYVLHSGLDTSHFKLLETGKEREHEEAGVEPGADGGRGTRWPMRLRAPRGRRRGRPRSGTRRLALLRRWLGTGQRRGKWC